MMIIGVILLFIIACAVAPEFMRAATGILVLLVLGLFLLGIFVGVST